LAHFVSNTVSKENLFKRLNHHCNFFLSIQTSFSTKIKELIAEGHDINMSRRALAFADMNVEIARAILMADQEDAYARKGTLQILHYS
jgi:hypothetical protein